jgi:hypothetical protein
VQRDKTLPSRDLNEFVAHSNPSIQWKSGDRQRVPVTSPPTQPSLVLHSSCGVIDFPPVITISASAAFLNAELRTSPPTASASTTSPVAVVFAVACLSQLLKTRHAYGASTEVFEAPPTAAGITTTTTTTSTSPVTPTTNAAASAAGAVAYTSPPTATGTSPPSAAVVAPETDQLPPPTTTQPNPITMGLLSSMIITAANQSSSSAGRLLDPLFNPEHCSRCESQPSSAAHQPIASKTMREPCSLIYAQKENHNPLNSDEALPFPNCQSKSLPPVADPLSTQDTLVAVKTKAKAKVKVKQGISLSQERYRMKFAFLLGLTIIMICAALLNIRSERLSEQVMLAIALEWLNYLVRVLFCELQLLTWLKSQIVFEFVRTLLKVLNRKLLERRSGIG